MELPSAIYSVRLVELWDHPKYGCPAKHGSSYYYNYNSGLQNHRYFFNFVSFIILGVFSVLGLWHCCLGDRRATGHSCLLLGTQLSLEQLVMVFVINNVLPVLKGKRSSTCYSVP